MGAHRRRVACLLVVGVACCAAAGCGSSPPKSHAGAAPSLRVSERDFKISAPPRAAAGAVSLSVTNRGPDDHELILVRVGSRLPMRRDGLTMDEDAVEKATLGAIEPAEPGAVHRLRIRLTPGRYELLCNMSGHYMGGMRKTLVVQ